MEYYNNTMEAIVLILFLLPLLLFIIDRWWCPLFRRKNKLGKQKNINMLAKYLNIDNSRSEFYLNLCSNILDVPIDYLNIELNLKDHPCGIPIDPVISIANYMENELQMETDEKALENTKLKDVIASIINKKTSV